MELYRRINWLFTYCGSVLDVLARWENLMEALQWCCMVVQRSPWASSPAPLQTMHSLGMLHVALLTRGLASWNGVGVFTLYDWWLYPGTGNKGLQVIARNNLFWSRAMLYGGTHLLTRSCWWQLETIQKVHEEMHCCKCWDLRERNPLLEIFS